jgi:iron-sulfur cluster assembly protein
VLTMTETASAVVKTIVAQSAGAETGGLRIHGSETDATAFEVAVAGGPEPADAVVERDGARVFLEPVAATALDDRELDAQVDGDGSFRFAIKPQG